MLIKILTIFEALKAL